MIRPGTFTTSVDSGCEVFTTNHPIHFNSDFDHFSWFPGFLRVCVLCNHNRFSFRFLIHFSTSFFVGISSLWRLGWRGCLPFLFNSRYRYSRIVYVCSFTAKWPLFHSFRSGGHFHVFLFSVIQRFQYFHLSSNRNYDWYILYSVPRRC